ncbi:MAG: carboxypeptidase regulatory-like domain-containing protein [Archangiaceae bacterium]|nr:carboxypeptidase regulatory-like domain-containing protein [Archangiaceae bacterium]
MRRASLLCCFAVACGSGTDANHDGIADGVVSPDSVSMVAPSTPVGTLSGQVLGTDFKPIEGVAVTVLVGGASDGEGNVFKASTDNEGTWAVKLVPAGANAQVTLGKAGYSTARVSAFVPATAGNFPINNGNANVGTVLLTKTDGTLKLQVVTQTGHPVKGHKVTLEVTPAAVRPDATSTGYGATVGMFVSEATTDDSGVAELKEIPGLGEEARLGGTYSVSMGEYHEDASGTADFLGTRRDFTARELFNGSASTVLTLLTAHASGPLQIVASNVDSIINGTGDPLKSMVKPGETLYFVFDQRVIEQSVSVKVTDETGLSVLTNTKMLSGTGNILQVTVTPATESGREYNLAMRATSAENGTTLSKPAYFFGGDPATPKPFAIEKVTFKRNVANPSTQMRLEPGDRVTLLFNQPVRNSGGQSVEVLIDFDINGSGTRGDVVGEKSLAAAAMPNTTGFLTVANEPFGEPMSTFTNLLSGYTTRHEFIYTGAMYVPVPIGTQFTATFSEIPSSVFGYRTIWGAGVEADAVGALSAP